MDNEEVRVLVVDDNADFVEALALSLQLDGYTVRTALTGDTALALCNAFLPQCVLMDIQMPGLDGHELCKCLRATFGDEAVLIAVTGYGQGDDALRPAFAHFDHYLLKPVDPTELRRILPPLR